jgi:kinesin family protein C1
MYKLLQEYNSSLQLYNSKLQTDLDTAHENVKRGEKEKAAIVENLSTLRGQCMSLQDQYNSCKVSLYWSSFFLLLVEVLNHFP